MQTVFLVQHLLTRSEGREDVKTIGVYASIEEAEAAIKRAACQPGFRDYPILINPLVDDETDGFYIDQFILGKDHWAKGFSTSP